MHYSRSLRCNVGRTVDHKPPLGTARDGHAQCEVVVAHVGPAWHYESQVARGELDSRLRFAWLDRRVSGSAVPKAVAFIIVTSSHDRLCMRSGVRCFYASSGLGTSATIDSATWPTLHAFRPATHQTSARNAARTLRNPRVAARRALRRRLVKMNTTRRARPNGLVHRGNTRVSRTATVPATYARCAPQSTGGLLWAALTTASSGQTLLLTRRPRIRSICGTSSLCLKRAPDASHRPSRPICACPARAPRCDCTLGTLTTPGALIEHAVQARRADRARRSQ